MNSYTERERIIGIIRRASRKIQIAVSWLTDEVILQNLSEAARKLSVELLIANDPLNAAFQYNNVIKLQESGAIVRKPTPLFGDTGFLHAKFMIIDEKIAYGGSFNFTANAVNNLEQFERYENDAVGNLKNKFSSWLQDSIDYKKGFENVKELKKIVLEQFERQKEVKNRLYQMASEREILIREEVRKEQLRKRACELTQQKIGVNKNGELESKNESTVVSKKHKFYGGQIRSDFKGNKLPMSYANAHFQKRLIKKSFPFIRSYIVDDTLICNGVFTPDSCSKYPFRLEYRHGYHPKVYILKKCIGNNDIHMYNDQSLCLFYPGELKWKSNFDLGSYIIPWVLEWILYYEIYQYSGKWEGPEMPHGTLRNQTSPLNPKFA